METKIKKPIEIKHIVITYEDGTRLMTDPQSSPEVGKVFFGVATKYHIKWRTDHMTSLTDKIKGFFRL